MIESRPDSRKLFPTVSSGRTLYEYQVWGSAAIDSTSHASGRFHRNAADSIATPPRRVTGERNCSVARTTPSHSNGHRGKSARLTTMSATPPTIAALIAFVDLEAATIGRPVC